MKKTNDEEQNKVIDKGVWIYDIETLAGCFTYTALNLHTGNIIQYVIHKDRCDLPDLVEHLYECSYQIGFNNISFDYLILHYILENADYWMSSVLTVEHVIQSIYEKSQDIINEQDRANIFNIPIKYKETLIPQLDLFRIWHFNNKARRTSLKALEVAMNFENVMDMPIHHSTKDINVKDIELILEYNLNDVKATFEFLNLSLKKIDLRKGLKVKYGLPCLNYPDSKIGEELVLKLYCEKNKVNPWEIRKLRTNRPEIALKDVIFDYIKFKTGGFQELVKRYQKIVIYEDQIKGVIEDSVIFKGFKYEYGGGGIHGCIKSGMYISDNEYVIRDADVASLYPNIAIVNKLYPEHLGESFYEVYENDIVKPRIAAKKAGDKIMADGFKLSANSVYGKSNDKYSFLKDTKYTLATTINGQLMLTMLAEQLVLGIEDLTVLQINTDGITVRLKKSDLERYDKICKNWEELTKLTLEFVDYKLMAIADVNNYIAISTSGKIKCKGRFRINDQLIQDDEWHKDFSFNICRKAILEYFTNGIPVENTIKNCKNIYDFCGKQKFGHDSKGTIVGLINHEIVKEDQQKITRYYISNKGFNFIKTYSDGSSEKINKGYLVTIFNKFIDKPIEEYDINYSFYIKEAMKDINIIEDKQYSLQF